LVLIDEPGAASYGGVVAAPVFRAIAGTVLKRLGVESPALPLQLASAPAAPAAKKTRAPARSAAPAEPSTPSFLGLSRREALGRGARAVITTGEVDAGGAPVVCVDAPERLLARAAAHLAGDPSAALTLVGVTGTNGKTTTTYLLEAIWRAAGRRPGVVGTITYRFDGASRPAPLTTPDPIALQALLAEMRAAGTTHVALEVSSHALAQERVAGCRFDAAVFTNLTRDHLDFHGDLERYSA